MAIGTQRESKEEEGCVYKTMTSATVPVTCLQVCTDLTLFLTLFSSLFPDLLLLFGSKHEGHGWGGGLSHRGVQGDRVLNVYSDLFLVDVPA